MPKRIVELNCAPQPVGPYSQAVRSNGLIFTAGQLPIDAATGELVGSDIVHQTKQALRNLAAVLSDAGVGLEAIVKTTVFLKDLADFEGFNCVYASFFDSEPPARSTVEVSRLPRGARIEIEAIAAQP